MIQNTAVLTRLATSLDRLLIMNVITASSWWEIGIESVSTLATGVEMNQFARVCTCTTKHNDS